MKRCINFCVNIQEKKLQHCLKQLSKIRRQSIKYKQRCSHLRYLVDCGQPAPLWSSPGTWRPLRTHLIPSSSFSLKRKEKKIREYKQKSAWLALAAAREPFKPISSSLPFLVYYTSRYRGICVGTLVARAVVLTAAVCVTSPVGMRHDTRSVTVVVGSSYRHPRRGIRVQVTKILIPKLPEDMEHRAYLLQKSAAVLLLRRKVPDILVENPLRPLSIDYAGEEELSLQEECFMPGWHFFYRGDRIYPVHKFHLQRNVRAQFLNIVKMHLWCDALSLRFQNALANVGFEGFIDKNSQICIRDGMYGAPLVCRGRAVAMMMAPDAQWANCTGFSNILHLLSGSYLRAFMTCVSSLFDTEIQVDWEGMKNRMFDEDGRVDYLPMMYDKLVINSDSSSDEL